jgi:hypothetical protein
MRLLSRSCRFGGVRVLALLAFFGAAGMGAVGYHYLAARKGEAAIQLIPADAAVVITLDTHPSVTQIPTFKRIADAIRREGLAGEADRMISSAFDRSSIGLDMHRNLTNSFAFAALRMPGQEDPDWVTFLALNDVGRGRAALEKNGRRESAEGLEFYRLEKEKAVAALMGDYIVFAAKPEALQRIESVRRGGAPSVESLPEYERARASLPADASLMVFISQNGLAMAGQKTRETSVNPFKDMGWVAVGAAVRDQGIQFVWQVPSSREADPAVRKLGEIAPVDLGVERHLPAGAYGMMILSQPGSYWDAAAASISHNPQPKKSLDEALATFEEESGLNVPRDIVPSLTGHFVLAVYPAPGDPNSVDGLVLIDDASGANPSALADRLRAYLEAHNKAHFTPERREGVTIWSLDMDSQEKLRRSASERASALPVVSGSRSSAAPEPGTGSPGRSGGSGTEEALKKKSVVFAQAGQSVLLASSRAMLEQALVAFSGGPGLSMTEDPAYRGSSHPGIAPGAQGLAMINLARIMEALQPYLKKSLGNEPSEVKPDDLVQLFGRPDTALAASWKYDGQANQGMFFLPLDYDRAIHLIGVGARKSAPKSSRPRE